MRHRVEQPERRECAQPDQRAAVGNHRLGTEWASRHIEEEEEDDTEEAERLARAGERDQTLAALGGHGSQAHELTVGFSVLRN